jgi:hypothetical protein
MSRRRIADRIEPAPRRTIRMSWRPIVMAVGVTLVATACMQSQAAPPRAAPATQDASQTCAAAGVVVRQVLAMRTDTLSAAQYNRAVALAYSLRNLSDAAEDDVLQERLNYTADAAQTLAAAVRAGDASAVQGARDVVKGFGRTCPVTNSMFTQGTTEWAGDSAKTVLRSRSRGPMGGSALEVSDLQPGTCGFHDAPRAVTSTLPGLYRLRLWVRAQSGRQKVAVHVDEMVGTARVGQTIATVTAGTSWQRVAVSVRPKAPGRSALSLGVTTTTGKAGVCFLAGNVSVTWG